MNCPLNDPQAADRIAIFLKKKGTNADGHFDWTALGRQSCKCFNALPRISCGPAFVSSPINNDTRPSKDLPRKQTHRCASKAHIRRLNQRKKMQQARSKVAKKPNQIKSPAFCSPDNVCSGSMTITNPSTPSSVRRTQDSRKQAPTLGTQDSRKKAPTLVTQAAINDINRPNNSVPDTPIIPRKIRLRKIQGSESTFTPETQRLMSTLARKMKEKSPTTQDKMFSKTKEYYRQHRPGLACSASAPSKQPALDMEAYHYYRPEGVGSVSKEWRGKRRASHHIATGDIDFDEDKYAHKARRHAVRGVVKALLENKDEDQVGLTLLYFLDHPIIRPYLGQILTTYNSGAVQVGLHATKGMEQIVRMVAEGREKGGRSKECRALLSIIGMCLADGLDDNTCSVSRETIYRTVFKSLPRSCAQRLLIKSGKKRKRFQQKEMREFRCVEEEKRRSKLTDEDYIALRKYMCNNRYTRYSPNAEDTVRARTIHGEFSN